MRTVIVAVMVGCSSCAWNAVGADLLAGRGYSYRMTPQANVVGFNPSRGCEQFEGDTETAVTQGEGADCRVLATRFYPDYVDWPEGVSPASLKGGACEGALDAKGSAVEKQWLLRKTTLGGDVYALQEFGSLDRLMYSASLVLHDAARLRADRRWRSIEAIRQQPSTDDLDYRPLVMCELWQEAAPRAVVRETQALETALAALPPKPSLATLFPLVNRAARGLARLPADARFQAVAQKLLTLWQVHAFEPWLLPEGVADAVAEATSRWIAAYAAWRWLPDGRKPEFYAPDSFVKLAHDVEWLVPKAVNVSIYEFEGRRLRHAFSAERGARDGALTGAARWQTLSEQVSFAEARSLPREVTEPYFEAFSKAAHWPPSVASCLSSSDCRTPVPTSFVDASILARNIRFSADRLSTLVFDQPEAVQAVRRAWVSAAAAFRADGAPALAALCQLRADLSSPVVVNEPLSQALGSTRFWGLPTARSGAGELKATVGALDVQTKSQRTTVHSTDVIEERKPKDAEYYATLRQLDHRIDQARGERIVVPGSTTRECKAGFDYCTEYKTGDTYKTGDDALVEQLFTERKAFTDAYERVTKRTQGADRTETVTTHTLTQTLTVSVGDATQSIPITVTSSKPEMPVEALAKALTRALEAGLTARLARPGPATTKANAELEQRARKEWLDKPFETFGYFESALARHPFVSGASE